MAYGNSYTNYGSPGQGVSTSADRGPGTPVQQGMGGDPGQQYYQQTGYYGPQVQQASAIAALFGPQQAYANALGQQQVTALEQGQWFGNESLQNQINQTNQNAMFQQAGFGLDQQSLGIQQGALARQLGELPAQYGLQQQGFGLQEQQIGLNEKSAWQQAGIGQRNLQSQLTASGNPYSVGGGWQRQDITNQLQNQLAGFGLNRQQVGLQRQGAAQNYFEQTASMQDQQKQLGIQGQRLGLSEQEVTSRLNSALQQLGLQGQMSAAQVAGEISKVQQGMISPLGGMMSFFNQYLPGLLSPGGG